MTRYVRIQASGPENFAYLLGLFSETGHTVDRFAGGNEFYVPVDLDIENEIRQEIADAVRPGTLPIQFAPKGRRQPAPPEPAAEPAAAEELEAEQADLPPLPPKAGAGSGRAAWAEAAETRGLIVTGDMSRDDIVDAIESWEAVGGGG